MSKSLVLPTVCLRLIDRSDIPFFRFNFVALSFRTDCRRLLMLHSVFSVFVSDSERLSLLPGDSDLSECLFKLSDRLSGDSLSVECLFKLSDIFNRDVVFSQVLLFRDSDRFKRDLA